jgi:hypothetical protein
LSLPIDSADLALLALLGLLLGGVEWLVGVAGLSWWVGLGGVGGRVGGEILARLHVSFDLTLSGAQGVYLLFNTLCSGLWVRVLVKGSIGMSDILSLHHQYCSLIDVINKALTPAPTAPASSEYSSFFPGALAYPLLDIEYP